MKASDLRQLDVGVLKMKLVEKRQEYFELRFQHATTPIKKTSSFPQVRRVIARILTVLREKE